MGLVFTPKIAAGFDHLKPEQPSPAALRIYNSWSEKELKALVSLRAIGVSYRDIARLLHRSKGSCAIVMSRKNLADLCRDARFNMINGIMKRECDK